MIFNSDPIKENIDLREIMFFSNSDLGKPVLFTRTVTCNRKERRTRQGPLRGSS